MKRRASWIHVASAAASAVWEPSTGWPQGTGWVRTVDACDQARGSRIFSANLSLFSNIVPPTQAKVRLEWATCLLNQNCNCEENIVTFDCEFPPFENRKGGVTALTKTTFALAALYFSS